MFIALDPATNCGWAAWAPGMEKPASGSFELPSDDDDLGRCGYQLHVNLQKLETVHGFERVYYEAPLAPSQVMGQTQLKTIAKAFTIAGHIESYCYAKNLRCRVVHQASWRRTFLGRGTGVNKDTFKNWSRERCRQLGWNTRTHDEADALGILDYAIGLDPQFKPPWRDQFMFEPMSVPVGKRRR
jgi:hypothetical protein